MWSPINIAKVATEDEEATSPPLPPQEATPRDAAQTVGTGEIFETGSDVRPHSLEGGTVGEEDGVETERPDVTDAIDATDDIDETDETDEIDDRSGTMDGTPDDSPIQEASSASDTHEIVTEDDTVDQALNGSGVSPSVRAQDAASKSEMEGVGGEETLKGYTEAETAENTDTSQVHEVAEEQ